MAPEPKQVPRAVSAEISTLITIRQIDFLSIIVTLIKFIDVMYNTIDCNFTNLVN